jgi:sirohydrochlorin ferrochelatase
MTAPALVTLACGPIDARAAATVRDIAAATRRLRPDLRIEPAFCTGGREGLAHVVATLAARGVEEVVAVPLVVTSTEQTEFDIRLALDDALQAHPATRIRASGLVGADATLLSALDERMRSALRMARVRELDAVVLAAAGGTDRRALASIARVARLWSGYHHVPTSIAFASAAPPSTGEAVRDWRRQGKRHIAVGSLFITSGPQADRAEELGREAGACAVSAPLGAHEALSRLIVARYSVGAFALVPV